jgi:hypothetical protein
MQMSAFDPKRTSKLTSLYTVVMPQRPMPLPPLLPYHPKHRPPAGAACTNRHQPEAPADHREMMQGLSPHFSEDIMRLGIVAIILFTLVTTGLAGDFTPIPKIRLLN